MSQQISRLFRLIDTGKFTASSNYRDTPIVGDDYGINGPCFLMAFLPFSDIFSRKMSRYYFSYDFSIADPLHLYFLLTSYQAHAQLNGMHYDFNDIHRSLEKECPEYIPSFESVVWLDAMFTTMLNIKQFDTVKTTLSLIIHYVYGMDDVALEFLFGLHMYPFCKERFSDSFSIEELLPYFCDPSFPVNSSKEVRSLFHRFVKLGCFGDSSVSSTQGLPYDVFSHKIASIIHIATSDLYIQGHDKFVGDHLRTFFMSSINTYDSEKCFSNNFDTSDLERVGFRYGDFNDLAVASFSYSLPATISDNDLTTVLSSVKKQFGAVLTIDMLNRTSSFLSHIPLLVKNLSANARSMFVLSILSLFERTSTRIISVLSDIEFEGSELMRDISLSMLLQPEYSWIATILRKYCSYIKMRFNTDDESMFFDTLNSVCQQFRDISFTDDKYSFIYELKRAFGIENADFAFYASENMCMPDLGRYEKFANLLGRWLEMPGNMTESTVVYACSLLLSHTAHYRNYYKFNDEINSFFFNNKLTFLTPSENAIFRFAISTGFASASNSLVIDKGSDTLRVYCDDNSGISSLLRVISVYSVYRALASEEKKKTFIDLLSHSLFMTDPPVYTERSKMKLFVTTYEIACNLVCEKYDICGLSQQEGYKPYLPIIDGCPSGFIHSSRCHAYYGPDDDDLGVRNVLAHYVLGYYSGTMPVEAVDIPSFVSDSCAKFSAIITDVIQAAPKDILNIFHNEALSIISDPTFLISGSTWVNNPVSILTSKASVPLANNKLSSLFMWSIDISDVTLAYDFSGMCTSNGINTATVDNDPYMFRFLKKEGHLNNYSLFYRMSKGYDIIYSALDKAGISSPSEHATFTSVVKNMSDTISMSTMLG